MSKILTLVIVALLLNTNIYAQPKIVAKPLPANTTTKQPKLFVGLVVDQMRWDYLYRYQNRYGNNGFNKLLKNGYSCNNTFINYTPTVTAAGHTCIYTGSVPALHGIMGNSWYNKATKKSVYCTEDSTVKTVGSYNNNGKMSPANMLATTVTDELKLATNQKSKVVGICIKDRGSILPAGHSADAAYWYDNKTGNFITSTYYMPTLPTWVTNFNNQKNADAYYAKNWETLYPISTYTQSTDDNKLYEAKLKNAASPTFPHNLTAFIGDDYDVLPSTPYGNNITIDMAKAAIDNMQLGKNSVTDFLAVSLSSTDYVGHKFGPNSIEIEDTYLRLDALLAEFLQYLDKTIGTNNYTLFITADHGVAHIPAYLKEHNIPSGSWDNEAMVKDLNKAITTKYGVTKAILTESNYQLYLNDNVLESVANKQEIINFILNYCLQQNGIANAFELKNLLTTPLQSTLREMLNNGYNIKRSGDIQIVLEPAWIDGGSTGTTHGLWNPYDSHIPMLWYGAGITKGSSNRTMYMTDIAPTVAALLHIQMPNTCIGTVMSEVLAK